MNKVMASFLFCSRLFTGILGSSFLLKIHIAKYEDGISTKQSIKKDDPIMVAILVLMTSNAKPHK